MNKIAIVIPYFNPVGYRSHHVKLTRSLMAYAQAGIGSDVFVSGAGKDKPTTANIAFWDEALSFMWHKERLINLAVRHLPPAYTHVVWADNDVVVGSDWMSTVSEELCKTHLVQCFRNAFYTTATGHNVRARVSFLLPSGDGAIGLAWGATRAFFTEGPGLFELALVGSGDAIFGCGVLQEMSSFSALWCQSFWRSLEASWSADLLTALDRWRSQLKTWLQVQRTLPSVANADVMVLQHGRFEDRRYADRNRLLDRLIPEEHLVADDDRIFQWTNAGLAVIEPTIRAYFRSRREDDL